MQGAMRVGAVIPGAGKGVRMRAGDAKQFMDLDGKPVVARTIEHFQSSPLIDAIVIAAAAEQIELMRRIVSEYRFSKVCAVVAGGVRRQDSVWNGLRALEDQSVDLVLVHDAVRPFIDQKILQAVLSELSHADAALLAVRAKDTVKLSGGTNLVDSTLSREEVWLAQTPQAFRYADLRGAFERAAADGYSATDEASLMERLGKKVAIVEGSYDNIKITSPEDLELARLMARRKQPVGEPGGA